MTSEGRYRLGQGPGYLSPAESGVAWMLNPEDPVLQQHAARQASGPATAADYRDYVADAEPLKDLIRHRHIAVVLDPEKARITDAIIDLWTHYLSEERPTTLAGCAETLGQDLGQALNDAHLHVRHSRHHRTSKDTLGDPLRARLVTGYWTRGLAVPRLSLHVVTDDGSSVLRLLGEGLAL